MSHLESCFKLAQTRKEEEISAPSSRYLLSICYLQSNVHCTMYIIV